MFDRTTLNTFWRDTAKKWGKVGTEELASLRLLQLEGAGYGMFCQEQGEFLKVRITERWGNRKSHSRGSWSTRWDLTAGDSQAVEKSKSYLEWWMRRIARELLGNKTQRSYCVLLWGRLCVGLLQYRWRPWQSIRTHSFPSSSSQWALILWQIHLWAHLLSSLCLI